MLTLIPPNNSICTFIADFPIRYYGIIMACSFLVGILFSCFLFKKRCKSNEMDIFLDYSPYIILLSVFGARLFYVLGSLDYYLKYPKEIIMINHGGMSIYGAIFLGIISMFIFSKKYKFNFFEHCDVIAVVLPLCQSIGRFGNYFNQEAFGLPSNSFIRLWVDKQYRPFEYSDIEYFHPTFLYSSVIDFCIFLFLLTLFLKNKGLKNGEITCIYLFLYSFARFFMEYVRIDSVLNIGVFSIAQIISLLLFISSLIMFIKIRYKKELS